MRSQVIMTLNNRYNSLIDPELKMFTFKAEFYPAIEHQKFLSCLKALESIPMLKALQSFNPTRVLNTHHLESAVWHAILAQQANKMISKSLSLEILLYLSCQRQIHKGIEYLGLKNEIESAGLVTIFKISSLDTNLTLSIQENFIREWRIIFKEYKHTIIPFTIIFNDAYAKDLINVFEIPFSIENISEKKLEDIILSKVAMLPFQ